VQNRTNDELRKLFELCQEFGVQVFEEGELRLAFDFSKVVKPVKHADEKKEKEHVLDKINAPPGADPRLLEFIRASGGEADVE
jgi:hypothetical protein